MVGSGVRCRSLVGDEKSGERGRDPRETEREAETVRRQREVVATGGRQQTEGCTAHGRRMEGGGGRD